VANGDHQNGGAEVRKSHWLGAVVGAVAGALVLAGPAAAETKPALTSVSIQGGAFVGETLRAVFEADGDPPTTIEYKWRRCKAEKPDDCSDIKGAEAVTYTVAAADLGFRLRVRVKLKNGAGDDEDDSFPTAVVSAAPPPGPPLVAPTNPASGGLPAAGPAAAAPAALRFLRPVPVVRVKGEVLARGARIVLWRVTAPRGARVEVRCAGPRCPLRRRSFRRGRIRPLERYLRAGVTITIRVTRRGFVGKYVRVFIRSGKVPKRRDACLMPGNIRPSPC
jgi:hypothetical protein